MESGTDKWTLEGEVKGEQFPSILQRKASVTTGLECDCILKRWALFYVNQGGTADYNICPWNKDRCFFILKN